MGLDRDFPTHSHQSFRPLWSIDRYENTNQAEDNGSKTGIPVLVGEQLSKQIYWQPGERFQHLFEETCDHIAAAYPDNKVALEYSDQSTTYAQLDKLANQMARFLMDSGIRAQDRIGLLFDRCVYAQAAVLAVLKIDAAYVPLDASFPDDRINYMLCDSEVSCVLTLSSMANRFKNPAYQDKPCDSNKLTTRNNTTSHSGIRVIALDTARERIETFNTDRLTTEPAESTADGLCYIIYTSGSTGRPKGVPISHSNICNFLRVTSSCYGYRADDRVYQSLTIAFDFSIEELWVPLMVGATVVPAPSGINLLGEDLANFLRERQITALCCVPTLLGTIENNLPTLRFIMVSGEACPQQLVHRWANPQRRFLNTYGPTEATVSATWLHLEPDTDVTIGGPLPSYSIVILSPDDNQPAPLGESGEICIAGIGLAAGYLNLPEKTNSVFINDFIGIAHNPSGKLYRTGDLGRINKQNQIEFHGRIDTQVKIRGYRIELDEIESVLMDHDSVSAAVVSQMEIELGKKELVAYVTRRAGVADLDMVLLRSTLRERLPSYMVPAYYEEIAEPPLTPAGKVDRKALPAPNAKRLSSSNSGSVPIEAGLQSDLAEVLKTVLNTDEISAEDHFFNDLGADSLLMAVFTNRISKLPGLRGLPLKQIYLTPTIKGLAAFVEENNAALSIGLDKAPQGPEFVQRTPDHIHMPEDEFASKFDHIRCGMLQVLFFIAFGYISLYITLTGFYWILGSDSMTQMYQRSVGFSLMMFFGSSAVLLALKLLVFRKFDGKPIQIWSLRYFRFWIAKFAVVANPLNLGRGTPLYNIYLRMLGARIGRRVTIFAKPPVCADLISVGDDTIIHGKVRFTAYKAHRGHIYTGPISIGSRSYISEAVVLDINTSIGDDAQIGTASVLYQGESVPDGKIFQGSPAIETTTNYDRVTKYNYGIMRRVGLVLFFIVLGTFGMGPMLTAGIFTALKSNSDLFFTMLEIGASLTTLALLSVTMYTLSFGMSLLSIMLVPRILNLFVKSDVEYRLFGIRHIVTVMMTRLTNSTSFMKMFGDSSLILYYFKAIGYDVSEATQTGSNAGTLQTQHSPFLCKFSRNTLVSDGLHLQNTDMNNTAFKISKISIPADIYIGNDVFYPVDAKLGHNCLLATKAMVPIDGPVRTGVGLLGSPCFEIPRSVERDKYVEAYKDPEKLKTGLRRKLKHNLGSMAMLAFKSVCGAFLTLTVFQFGLSEIVNGSMSFFNQTIFITTLLYTTLIFWFLFSIFYERLGLGFSNLEPVSSSLYDKRFWRYERFWKLSADSFVNLFNGTPIKPVVQRLRGLTVGRQVYDDGAGIPEPWLIKIGDHCCLNTGTNIQSHSLEDGSFKSDRITIGDRCSLGVNAFVHYGSYLDHESSVLADSFVMKGSVVEQGTNWFGNPAAEYVGTGNTEEEHARIALPPAKRLRTLRSSDLAKVS